MSNVEVVLPQGVPASALFTYYPLQVIYRLSTQYLIIPVNVFIEGSPYTPTTDPVSLAFTSGFLDLPSEWFSGSWDSIDGALSLLCLIGPANGGVPLSPGNYFVWVEFPKTPEVIVTLLGQVRIS